LSYEPKNREALWSLNHRCRPCSRALVSNDTSLCARLHPDLTLELATGIEPGSASTSHAGLRAYLSVRITFQRPLKAPVLLTRFPSRSFGREARALS